VTTKTKPREQAHLTPAQIAARLAVSNDRVISWIRKGWLEAVPLPRGYRISQASLDRFLAERPWEA
jgi:excisionase family DNA binding protein